MNGLGVEFTNNYFHRCLRYNSVKCYATTPAFGLNSKVYLAILKNNTTAFIRDAMNQNFICAGLLNIYMPLLTERVFKKAAPRKTL